MPAKRPGHSGSQEVVLANRRRQDKAKVPKKKDRRYDSHANGNYRQPDFHPACVCLHQYTSLHFDFWDWMNARPYLVNARPSMPLRRIYVAQSYGNLVTAGTLECRESTLGHFDAIARERFFRIPCSQH